MHKSLLAVTLVFAAGAANAQTAAKPTEWVGKEMPQFGMKTLDGKVLDNKALAGKPYVLDFWATWCGPCKKAAPMMQEMHAKFAEQGLVVIGANTFEQGDAQQKALAYVKEHGYGYTFTYGNDELAQKLNITGIPTFFFVDANGMVSDVIVGYADTMKEKFWTAANKLLAGSR